MVKKEKDTNDICSEEYWEKKFGKDFCERIEKKFENWGKCNHKWHDHSSGFMGGGIYGLGFLATLIYYIQTSDSFWMGVLGVLKALVWPAMLIYEVFTRLNM